MNAVQAPILEQKPDNLLGVKRLSCVEWVPGTPGGFLTWKDCFRFWSRSSALRQGVLGRDEDSVSWDKSPGLGAKTS